MVAEDSRNGSSGGPAGSFTPCGIYSSLWLESRAEGENVSYHMDSAIAPDRRSAAAERVDSSSVFLPLDTLANCSHISTALLSSSLPMMPIGQFQPRQCA